MNKITDKEIQKLFEMVSLLISDNIGLKSGLEALTTSYYNYVQENTPGQFEKLKSEFNSVLNDRIEKNKRRGASQLLNSLSEIDMILKKYGSGDVN